MKKVAIISTGCFPIPAVMGGAVESLIDMLIEENEKQHNIEMHVFSAYNHDAEIISELFKYTVIHYIKTPGIIQIFDKMIYLLAKKILRKENHMSYRYIFQKLYFMDRAAKELHSNDYDRVVIENHIMLCNTLKKYGNRKKYKDHYYYHAHNLIFSDHGCREIFNNSKAIISVSNYIQNEMMRYAGDNNIKEFRVLRNRIDENRFRNIDFSRVTQLKEKYGIKENQKIVMFTGRLSPEKGVLELMEAFKRADIKDCKLMIVGSYFFGSNIKSDYETKLANIAAELQDRILFTGYVDYAEMPLYYALADVIALPSVWNDPAPLTVIEAITAGKPLITTDSGGIPEYATPDVAYIVPYSDEFTEKLKDAISALMNHDEERIRLGRNAREKSRNWTSSGFYQDFLKCIDIEF